MAKSQKLKIGNTCPYCGGMPSGKGGLITHIMRKHPGADYTPEGIKRAVGMPMDSKWQTSTERTVITLTNMMPKSMIDAEKQDKHARPHNESVRTISGGGGPGSGKRR